MDYRVPDPSRVWPVLQRSESALADLGAHYVLVYTSTREHGRVMVTISLRSKEPILEVLRSRVFLNWFDAVGLDDIPAIFAGETVDKVTLVEPSEENPPGVIVGAIAAVDDVSAMIRRVHRGLPRFEAAGVRAVRIFKAFDDDHEVMILQELDDEADASDWVNHPDVAAEWMGHTGVGAYPPVFVGRLQHIMRLDESV
ncbi:fatty-acid--CoA ligase [Mycolicibacterium rhodesiae]|uniref:Fatty-acid--CoA ligase n=1 Tax=Mycolicibacterium rhodesiae TaxID=36814 RepID=A0A1X0IUG8_MYCRH|nr:fatty-acid--CoA ligase [Mycolicibacterium rhodesiae]MCV7345883.1 fatty-acid--CoA ligase [Mycolicibacterium rhodesiae]ORB52441.1 fatty-acid--CoA ligase [Mycolicibacterium rhodesiae]